MVWPRDENGGQPSSETDLFGTGSRHSQAGRLDKALQRLPQELCAPVTSLLKAGSILQQIAALGGWQPTTEPKPSRKDDCHS